MLSIEADYCGCGQCEAALHCRSKNVDLSLLCRLSKEHPPLEATAFFWLLLHREQAAGKLNVQHLTLHCHSLTKAPFVSEKSAGLILIF